MKLNEKAFAHSCTIVCAVVYLLCAILAIFSPKLLLAIYQPWFHGLDVSRILMTNPPGLGSIITGLITLSVSIWIATFACIKLYNYFVKSKE